LYALIFCGGGGTRLWPYSKEKKPKQFLTFGGDKTLLEQTYERVSKFIPQDKIYLITLPDYLDDVKKYLKNFPSDQIIAEPARRDTLLAAGYGAVFLQKKDPDAIITNVWADQKINDSKSYSLAILAGAKTAWDNNALVTTGVRPEYAHPGLEYVKKGASYERNGVSVYRVDKFIERPEKSGEDPEAIFRDKKTLWHTGFWTWKAKDFLAKVEKHTPDTYQYLLEIDKSLNSKNWKKEVEEVYKKSPKVQIDMVISKDQNELFVVEGEFDWLDLGDFNVLWKMTKKDKNFNASILKNNAEWINIDTEGTFVFSEDKKVIATVGIKGLAIVSVGDSILIVPRAEAQKVKKLIEKLKEDKRTELL
jgi:mannose-1-phosphate guanylyltransferase